MKYNSELNYQIEYYDPKADNMIEVNTDSLAKAIIALITRSRRHPKKRIDLIAGNKLLGSYEDGEYHWQWELQNSDWQKYIQYKLEKKAA